MILSRGIRLQAYQILSPLGSGGMGEVYRARDTRLDRDVAIKVLSEPFARQEEALFRFEREAKALAALSHPNILTIHDIATDQGLLFVVMELLEGETVRDRIKRSAIFWKETLRIGIAITDGLSAAHSRGIIHRDLKPENVFLTTDGQVKILDFGLARVDRKEISEGESWMDTSPALSQPGIVVGALQLLISGPHRDKGAARTFSILVHVALD